MTEILQNTENVAKNVVNEKPKKERMTCKRYCPVWNDIDHDCEIFGEHHFTPRTCPHYQKEIQNEKSADIR